MSFAIGILHARYREGSDWVQMLSLEYSETHYESYAKFAILPLQTAVLEA